MREGHARRRERKSNRGRSRWNEGTCGRLDTFGFKGAWRDVRDITKKQKCCQTRKEKGMRKGGENVGNHHLLWRRSSERPWRWLAPHVSCFARRVMLARHYRWWYTRNENVFLPNSERGSRLLFIWVRRKKKSIQVERKKKQQQEERPKEHRDSSSSQIYRGAYIRCRLASIRTTHTSYI